MMKRCVLPLLAGLFALGPASEVRAHPHLFLDSGLAPVFDDQGRLAAVRVIWIYDAFYSLMMVEDFGLDPDGDGKLTEDEVARFAGFDQRPEEGFTGITRAYQGARELNLTPPLRPDVLYENGQLISTHLRAFDPPVTIGADPVLLRTFDPSYYAAFELSLEGWIEGDSPCAIERVDADLEAANARLEAVLADLQGTDFDDDDFPEVGEDYADSLRVTCPDP